MQPSEQQESGKQRQAIDKSPDAAIESCIVVLLRSLEERINDPRDDPTQDIGKVTIIVDAEGMIVRRVEERGQNGKCGAFFMCVGTPQEAYSLELLLAQRAYDRETIGKTIQTIDKRYVDPDWETDLEIASEEVAEVLLKAIVITPGSPMHTFLSDAARTPLPRCS